jgi:serine/threonine-protein kinase RsbW
VGVIQLRVPGTLAYRNIALRAVSEACKMVQQDLGEPWDELEAHAVSAVGEAFNNVAIHGYAGLAVGYIDTAIGWTTDELVIQITDNGHSFDPQAVEPLDLDELHESGMGLFIMRSFMDRVDYEPGPPNVLRMVKYRVAETEGDGRGSRIVGVVTEPGQPVVTMSASGEDHTTSRSEWRIKAVDSRETGTRAVGGSRRG